MTKSYDITVARIAGNIASSIADRLAFDTDSDAFDAAVARRSVNIAQQIVAELQQSIPPPAPVPTTVPASRVPLAYAALTDRDVRTKPPLPTLGPAGVVFRDPAFGSRVLRVTDAATMPGALNSSFRVQSSAHSRSWNASSRRFHVMSNGGGTVLHQFDPVAFQARKWNPLSGDSDVASYVEPTCSLVDPDLLFGAGPGRHVIAAYRVDDTNLRVTTTPLLDLDSLGLPDLGDDTYIGGVLSGGLTRETILAFFGGTADTHHYVVVIPTPSGVPRVIDTLTRPELGFHLHAVQIDKSGQYVFLYPSGADRAAAHARTGDADTIAQVYLWDLVTDVFTKLTADMRPTGHDEAGFGVWINQACCSACSWDAAQWQHRTLADPAITKDLIVPILTPKEIYMADHTSWHNVQPDNRQPILSATYRYRVRPNDGQPEEAAPWRPWDDEVLAIETATPGAAARVWRFAHHRSNIEQDANPYAREFWYEPMINVSPDGRFALFTSNWEKTLGDDLYGWPSKRQDVFLVELATAA